MTDHTYDSLIEDLKKTLGADITADSGLEKARQQHETRKGQNIRALLERVASINEDLPDEAVLSIADAVAEAISNGNDSIKKARKSEIKLALEQRTHARDVLTRADAIISTAELKSIPKPNLRQLALGGLRAARKGTPVESWAEAITQSFDTPGKTHKEKLLASLDSLERKLVGTDGCTSPTKPTHLCDELSEALSTLRGFLAPTPAEDIEDPTDEAEIGADDTEETLVVPELGELEQDLGAVRDIPVQVGGDTIIIDPDPVVTPSDRETTTKDDDAMLAALDQLTGGIL